MAIDLSQNLISPAEFAVLRHSEGFELVNGQPVERATGNEANVVTSKLHALLYFHVNRERLGWVFVGEAGFIVAPRTVRKPDIAFIGFGRLPNERPARGFDTIAPDLVVEVVSPRDTVEDLETKIQEYLAAGVRLVWVVHPALQTVRIHRPDETTQLLHDSDTLSGEDVVPGFACPVAELFAFPQPPAAK